MKQVNYNDAADGREDLTWQEQGSDYNSDFSLPSDNDNDDEFDEKNESEYADEIVFCLPCFVALVLTFIVDLENTVGCPKALNLLLQKRKDNYDSAVPTCDASVPSHPAPMTLIVDLENTVGCFTVLSLLLEGKHTQNADKTTHLFLLVMPQYPPAQNP